VDKLTKYVLYIPTKNELKQEGFADLFLEHVVRQFGLPLEMIADRDPKWTKSFWQSIASCLGINLMLSTSHHPQHDGQMERANQTLKIILRALVTGERKSWSKWLSLLAHAYNTTPQSSTSYAPHFLLFGYLPRSELSLLEPTGRGIPQDETNNMSAVLSLLELDIH
jgi:transposase InsO family protein